MFKFIIFILSAISGWKIFEKAGREGWMSLIPFYNIYEEYSFCYDETMGIVAAVACCMMMFYSGFVGWIASIVYFVLSIVEAQKLSRSFGFDIGMTLLLIFIPFAGRFYIGFSNAYYHGKY